MEENNKVIIFELKEIIIILTIVVVLIITSFTLGIRLGKKLALDTAGVTTQDVKKVDDLKSPIEEDVEKTLSEDDKISKDEKIKLLMDETKNRLTENLEKFSTESTTSPANTTTITNDPVTPQSTMAGKYTIQLGSYATVEEAKQFAEGFTVRGYSPIINEVKIEGKGIWYRVSLGLFNSVAEAKDYIKKEQSLFSGQEYVISEIK